MSSFVVVKFGGSSVATAERIRTVVRLVGEAQDAAPDARHVVVVSALGGVTNQLVSAIAEAERRSGAHRILLDELRERHAETLAQLVPEGARETVTPALDAVFEELEELLQGIYLLREATPRFADAVLSAGERLSVPLVAAAFRAAARPARPVDARPLVRTDEAFGEATVDLETTRRLIRDALLDDASGALPVVTGFLGSTAEGVTTTLGRSGSDYTATLFAAALDAREVVIWTDVDGVLSADPRLVPEAFTLEHLSYREAAELAHFGAKVLHPRTMRPLEAQDIPLRIANTMNPGHPGTRVTADPPRAEAPVRALTTVRDVALVTLEGAGVLGVPDLTAQAFAALAERQVPVLLIAQASSEGSLCLAVRAGDVPEVRRTLERAFARAVERGDLRSIQVEDGMAVLAAVGAGMHRAAGLAGRMFATLGRAHVAVRAIAEGASDHNLSCAVRDADAARAVQALHEAFALRRLRAHVVLVGQGTIGSRLLALLGERAEAFRAEHRLHLRLVGVADSRRLLWDEGGLAFEHAAERLADQDGTDEVLGALTERLAEARLERVIVVDATPSAAVAKRYPAWLRLGAAVVTPNQQAFTFGDAFLDHLRDAARDAEAPFLYDTTVGAGLSVLSTLRDLVRTGDTVRRVEGVLSGTLAFVFAALRAGRPFSEAVHEAAERGLTEPDPRADLAGEDVRRKLLILAREMGLALAPDAVRVQSLVPEPLRAVSLDAFWQRLPELDAFWEAKRAEFAGRGQQLQYVSILGRDAVRAGVQALPADAPMVRLRGATILAAFHTERYPDEPLVVQGPGANAQLTAAVLLADLVRAAEAMR